MLRETTSNFYHPHQALLDLKQACLRCWAIELSDIYPKRENSYLASEELRKQGTPPCRCEGEARLTYLDRVGYNEEDTVSTFKDCCDLEKELTEAFNRMMDDVKQKLRDIKLKE